MTKESDEKKVLEDFVEEQKNSIDIRTKELIVTIILSLATLLSAWCGYQSNIWDDIQKKFSGERNLLLQDEVGYTLAGFQIRNIHSNLVIKILESWENGDKKMFDFFMARSDSNLRKVIEEWIKLDPLNNPDAPRNPFMMSSYKLEFDKKSEELSKQAEELNIKAKDANSNADSYLSLTVLLATVLFFTGIAGTLKSRRSQILSLSVSIIIFIISVVILFGLPVGIS